MTLRDIVGIIEGIANDQPAINSIVRNDIYRLNELNNVRYGVFSWVQREHSEDIMNGQRVFSFYLYYIDRLINNRENEVNIQSTGEEVLSNIIKTLGNRGIEVENPVRYTPFNYRFMDECAGVYVAVNIMGYADSVCGETFEK